MSESMTETKQSSNGRTTAEVELLTAVVRALMVGSRQVTLSVYRQLDSIKPTAIQPFGRVRDGRDNLESGEVAVVGLDINSGALAKSYVPKNYQDLPDKGRILSVVSADWRAQWVTIGLDTWYALDHSVYSEERDISIPLADGSMHVFRVHERECCFVVEPTRPAVQFAHREYGDPSIPAMANDIAVVHRALADVRMHEDWRGLPLIVLAGLR